MEDKSANTERRHVFYSGRVQGVGFRYTVQMVASGFRVSGFVRNLPDGRVELVAEGEAGELVSFLGRVNSEMGRNITSVDEKKLPATGEFASFTIAY